MKLHSVIASNENELQAALADPTVEEVKLANNVTITDAAPTTMVITKSIDGNGKTLKFDNAITKVGNLASAVVIQGQDGATVSNLTIELPKATTWNSNFGIQVYNSKNVTISDVTVKGGVAGILVNSSDVKLTGNINISDNNFGGIAVDSKDTSEISTGIISRLDATGANITYADESATQPTIWRDYQNAIDENRAKLVVVVPSTVTEKVHSATQDYFYYDSSNAGA